MKLVRYRVLEFRSVRDSGWIECDDVTTLVGVNEAGKSNLLTALWKLHPVKGGKIDLLADLPRKRYSELRDKEKKPIFIKTEFELPHNLIQNLVKITGGEYDDVRIASIDRDFNGNYYIGFPYAKGKASILAPNLSKIIENALNLIGSLDEAGKTEEGIKDETLQRLTASLEIIGEKEELILSDINAIIDGLYLNSKEMKTSVIRPILMDTLNSIREFKTILERPNPSSIEAARKLVLSELPSFVYYSNYGNLDSEIYLPHVIDNLKRSDLSGSIEAKVRTLRVLFEFVGLDPQEILELGKDPEPIRDAYGNVTQEPPIEEISKAAQNKTERDVLLQSASASLTSKFRDWWKQGNYRFDFHADGKHFRIWVSDEIRPEQVELEGRSTGLQWFLSFYLIFLVESQESHKGAILLLDEAGLSLHPLAQRDLSKFFESLSNTNQIINTTHSPFLVDTSHVDRVKVVYVDDEGYTVASEDLRAAEDKSQARSVYAIHAALGLSISDTLLQGCKPIIVEGPSDQFYLSAIKNFLISEQLIAPKEEIVFVPSGGVRGVEGIASLLSGKSDDLPFVLLDSDKPGRDFKNKLEQRLYKDAPDKIIEVFDITEIENSEVEDLIPFDMIRPGIVRLFRDVESEEFEDVYVAGNSLINQIQDFAHKHSIHLNIGWKVDLARLAKQRLLLQRSKIINDSTKILWQKLFMKFV
ncbi:MULTISPECIES: AAA family ATPase [unclassified Paenibacillus]|uniref:AAA family ATPase n=1 Tax=unclassified Paenibacillus TaxID=185978 RepID=UPI001AE39A6F|nr:MULTISPECIES: AAA family ATPase [unclassified Paenibacillus]MBP1157667.1 energy-coupling factor transporter ATP-binding protein EcfA2 [Paenibacillus sp. PvP091]MBP1171596.1 energy-coupling factor transporter ATP-binding protein EcfA2 [Paenibacillus sp. PvR098]MBP2437977.1 energy-coupling factor transporter ATP-binding protein EcfA2 [Paenibacillus sp. PvP052]